MTDQRFRINVSQTAKGFHQFDATIEMETDVFKNIDCDDVAKITPIKIGEKLLLVLKETEEAFRKDGRKLVIDTE